VGCRRGLAVVLLSSLLTSAGWAMPDPVEVGETLRRAVEQLRSTGQVRVAGQPILSVGTLPEIYETRGFRLLWTDAANEAALLGEIAAASGDGLNPADYHFDALRMTLQRRQREPDSAAVAATADILLSDALVRLAAHLHRGKVDRAGEPQWDLPSPVRGMPAAQLVTRIASGNALALQLGELRPNQPLYGRLKSALARYRVVEEQGGWETVPAGRVLQLGMEDARVPVLRRRLAASGDFEGVVVDSPMFEPALDEALRRFQARHQLEPDGIMGAGSLRELNLPVAHRMEQLRANLERARWLFADVHGYFLLADPAGGRVRLLENGRLVVDLGAEFAAQTREVESFRGEVRYFVANPDWILPQDLVDAQLRPLARRAPGALGAHGLQVFDEDGVAIEPGRIDWSRNSRLIVRQLPGPRSFLGTLHFPVSGDTRVFLHGAAAEDTAMPGSVRLQNPERLAHALAASPASSTPGEINDAIAGGLPRTFPLARGVPLLFGPWTAWVEMDGQVFFRPGYQDRDDRIIRGLRRAPAAR